MELVKPTLMATVPRVLEGIYSGIQARVKKEKATKRFAFTVLAWALTADLKARWVLEGLEPVFQKLSPVEQGLRLARAAIMRVLVGSLIGPARRLVADPIKERMGGCLRYLVSGGGALPGYIDLFFQSVGIPVAEGYGSRKPARCCRSGCPAARALHRGPPSRHRAETVDATTGQPIARSKGVVMARGPR